MIYRKLGKTGETISALGFGCLRLPEIEENGVFQIDQEPAEKLLRLAYEKGVNYFDTAFHYCHGNSEIALGKAVASFRDKILISTKCPVDEVKRKEDYRDFCYRSLEKLGTDYIDFYHFWAINKRLFDDVILKLGLLEEALRLKEKGIIRHISFSFHDRPKYIQYIIDRAPQMETILVQYNFLDRKNAKMMDYAAEKGLGVIVMGPVAGGRLALPLQKREELTGQNAAGINGLALRFVLNHPAVSCALSGMTTSKMVEQNTEIASNELPLSRKEKHEIAETRRQVLRFRELYCTGCRYCQPCPREIDIPRIFEIYTRHSVYGQTKQATSDWRKYRQEDGKTVKDCMNCGLCERKCPQTLAIRKELARVCGLMDTL